MPAPKLKLVKMIVQPVVVLDHGDHLTEIEHPPIAIPAEEWPAYSGDRFPQEMKEWQAQIDAEYAAAHPNRAQRRAAKTKPE